MKTDNQFHIIAKKFSVVLAKMLGISTKEYSVAKDIIIKEITKIPDIVFVPKNKHKIHWIVEFHNYKDESIYAKGLSMVGSLRLQNPENKYGCIIVFLNKKQDIKNADLRNIYNYNDNFKVIYLEEVVDKIKEINKPLWMVFQIFLAKNFDSLKNVLKDCKNVFWKNRKKGNSILLKEIFVYSLYDRFYKINKENLEEFIMTFRMGPSIEVRKKLGWGKEVYQEGMLEGKQEGLLEGKQKGRR